MEQLNLRYDPPIQIDIDKYLDEDLQIEYLGKATKQLDGSWRCLANVGGKLCLVEVKIKENIKCGVI
jgi:hypothetical protein